MTHRQLDTMFSDLQTALGGEADFPCEARKEKRNEGKPCLSAPHTEERDKSSGAPKFFYNLDAINHARKNLCPVCLTYWLIAVGRNVMLDHGRFHSNADDSAARIATANGDGSP